VKAIAFPTSAEPVPAELERLFREHAEFVYRTAFRVTGRAEDAEDVLQTLFAGLLGRDTRGIEDNPKAYLYRAAVNQSLNLIRARRRKGFVESVGEVEDVGRSTSWRQSRGDEAIRDQLRAALAELRPKAAEILILRYVHGYSNAEIARLLGTTRGTIAISLFRSRSRLRKWIRAYRGETL
jgi:RNA polymerase sigma-70 factor (ECF subfamily)